MGRPAIPNYTELAEKTAASNNPNINTAWGSQTRTKNADGTWTQTTTLNPEDQARLDAQRGNQMQATNIQGTALDQVANSMAQPFQSSAMDPGFGGVDALKDQYLEYTKPQMDALRDRYDSTMRQRGISMNSAAGESGMRSMMDADRRNVWEATDKATNAYDQMFNRGLAADENARINRNLPLSEALRLQQLTNPVTDPEMRNNGVGTDYVGAADRQYSAELAADNARRANKPLNKILGMVGTLGGAALGNPAIGGMLGGLFSGGGSGGNPIQGVGQAAFSDYAGRGGGGGLFGSGGYSSGWGGMPNPYGRTYY